MRKIASVILISCLFFTVLGYHLVFSIQLTEAKTAMKKALHSSLASKHIFTFIIDKEAGQGLEWENENEFNYKGEMYDVIERTEKDNHITIHCIADENESDIINEYLNRKNGSPDHSPSTTLLKLINSNFIPSFFNTVKEHFSSGKLNYSFRSKRLPDYLYPILTPPPRHLC